MAASTQSTLENVERRRAQLQENVEKLQKALTHWTTWEAEYQMLQEELQAAPDASPEQICHVARDLESKYLDEKEVEELLGKDLKTKRTANQVIDLISRRIDYVQKNSATIEKQLDTAEKQLAGVDVLLEPGVENEEGLPMMDIEEELDEENNVVSSSTNQTGSNAAELIEVLRKAGLQKAEMAQNTASSSAVDSSAPSTTLAKAKDVNNTASSIETTSSGPTEEPTKPLLKKVTFAEDTKPETTAEVSSFEKDGYNDALADLNFTKGTKVIELDQDDNEIASYPIIPQGESPEDAELRRQMLRYGLSEVGQIVAELDLDHPVAEYDDDEEDDDDYDYDTEDDGEDQYGRSIKSAITDDYRQQMMELEKKLNARMMENIGPDEEKASLAEHTGDIRTMRVRKDEDFERTLSTATADDQVTKKKGVRFADDLDISEPPRPTPQTSAAQLSTAKPASTISDTIVEHSDPASEVPVAPSKPTKVSRFKSARAANAGPKFLPTPSMPQPSPVPTGPSGRTLATTVVEHETSTAEPNVPDEYDPLVINRQIQTEYHKARNKFIQQQGGFNKPSEDEDEAPIVEDKDGKTKKVSRFMAARLKADGM